MENKFSKYSTGVCRIIITQNSPLESWKAKLNNSSKVLVIIINLSNVFDCLNHDLLLRKLEVYGLDNNAVSFMRSYWTNNLQHCKIDDSFSEWAKISVGVPQESVLGPLLFNILINYIFLFLQ